LRKAAFEFKVSNNNDLKGEQMQKYKRIVILTGAGISAESGIKTFRASDGLWENHNVEDVATPEGYQRDPKLVLNFYNERRSSLQQSTIQPNAAHIALAKLQKEFNGEVLLVTQNIDNLHERSGSTNVLHMHGELLKVRCPVSGKVFNWKMDLNPGDVCNCCAVHSQLRPHIVWFGEMPFQMDFIYEKLAECDLFIAIGTSGNVHPAAGFVEQARMVGADCIELNLEESNAHHYFTQHIQGKAGETVPDLVHQLLEIKANKTF
jgi:NAD-dependent deacetylase